MGAIQLSEEMAAGDGMGSPADRPLSNPVCRRASVRGSPTAQRWPLAHPNHVKNLG